MTKVLIGNIQGPPGGEGPVGLPQRQSVSITTSTLASNARFTGAIDIATSYRIVAIETTGPSRIRTYVTVEQRDADELRPLGVDPTGNHGVIMDFAFDSAWDPEDVWYPSPQVDAIVPTGISVPYHIDNLDTSSAVITVVLTYIRTE